MWSANLLLKRLCLPCVYHCDYDLYSLGLRDASDSRQRSLYKNTPTLRQGG